MLGTILLIFFALAGLLFLIWALFGLLLTPVFGEEMVTLCYCQGDGGDLERQVRAYGWLRDERVSGGRLVIVDCGLDEQGLCLAQLLRQDYDWLDYCPRPALEDYLELTTMT